MHTTQELSQACLRDPAVASLIQGVFPSDKLPTIYTYPAGLITNTDPHDQPGRTVMVSLRKRITWIPTF